MFNLRKIENARQNVPEPVFYEVKASEAVTSGEALVLSAGKLTKAGATVKPEYIAMADCSADATNREIPVCRVESNQIYEVEVTFSSEAVEIVAGTKVKLTADGLGVTDVTTSGVVTVVDALDANTNKTTGDKILVRIV